ncbi:MAG: alpha/beta hydrolase [Treponema sp.]|jgi:acetyl esterase/lipase|nr:alpha/beta hydrolase [Treponema sp.]
MRKIIDVHSFTKNKLVILTEGIEYARRWEWCSGAVRSRKLSLIHPRQHFEYDDPSREKQPVLVWLCGGGFTEMDRNVWLAEMAWFAKYGYTVASIDYGVAFRDRFPQAIVDIKEAIRYLRSNEDEFCIDGSRIAIMGESAGGYYSALAGVSGNVKEWD